MYRNMKKITALALTCCMLFSGCGTIDKTDSQDSVPDIIVAQEALEEVTTEDLQTVDVTTTIATRPKKSTKTTVVTTTAVTTTNTTATGTSKKRSGANAYVTSPADGSSGNKPVTTVAENQIYSNNYAVGELPVYTPPAHDVRENPNTTIKKEETTVSAENGNPENTQTSVAENADSTEAVSTTLEPLKASTPQELLGNMSLKQKVSQMFIVKPQVLTGYDLTAVDEDTRNSLLNYPAGGIIYFSDNLVSQEQTMQMINSTQEFSKESVGVGLFQAIDEEGGIVARAAEKLGTTAFSGMASYGERNDSQEAYYIGNTIGKDLHSLGFNLDFAPVADVNINPYNELGNRIFSSDPYVVANMADYVARGLQDAGVSATLKHFPGLGAENGNTHTDSNVYIERTLEQLWAEEFVAFQQGINSGVDFVMVGHQTVSGIGDGLPSDLSYYTVTTLLKEQLGFKGLVITDSHEMNTISAVYDSGTSAIMAIQAGCDIILMPYDFYSAVDAVVNAVNNGTISEERINESVLKILNQKYELGLFD